MYLKGFSPSVGDPSTLWTLVYVRPRIGHVDPSTLWTLVYVRPRIGHVRTFTLLG